MPLRRAFTLGAGFLIARPVRLVFCVIICVITLLCVGVAGSFGTYDKAVAIARTMQSYGTPYLSYVKKNGTYSGDFNQLVLYSSYKKMTAGEFDELSENIESSRVDGLYDLSLAADGESMRPEQLAKEYKIYYGSSDYTVVSSVWFDICGFMEMNAAFADDYGFTLYGNYPVAYDEAVITEHIYRGFVRYGYTEESMPDYISGAEYGSVYSGYMSGVISISSHDDLIGRTLTVGGRAYKIVGILDTRLDEQAYGDVLYGGYDGDTPLGCTS